MKKLALPLALVFLSSCSTIKNTYVTPEYPLPETWNQALSSEEITCDFVWWKTFNDQKLNELIQSAFYHNLDLSLAHYRLMEARAMEKGGESAQYPHVDASLAFAYAHYDSSLLKRLGIQPRHGSHDNGGLFEVGFDAEWEIDLFGRLALERLAAQATTESSIEAFNDLWVSLSAEVAKNYIELRHLQQFLILTSHEISDQKETLEMTSGLTQTGFLSTIEHSRAEQDLLLLEAKIPEIDLSIIRTMNRLCILVGKPLNEILCLLDQDADLPTSPNVLPLAIPSELLKRRPDIRKAERDLASACALSESATKECYPRLSLKGFIGEVASLWKGNLVGLINPSLLLPLFNSSLVEKDVAVSRLKAHQAAVTYQKTIYLAFEETENALASLKAEERKSEALQKALFASEDAHKLSLDLYHSGMKDYLEVLGAKKQLLSIRQASLQSQQAKLIHLISLYKALGGSFKIDSESSDFSF